MRVMRTQFLAGLFNLLGLSVLIGILQGCQLLPQQVAGETFAELRMTLHS